MAESDEEEEEGEDRVIHSKVVSWYFINFFLYLNLQIYYTFYFIINKCQWYIYQLLTDDEDRLREELKDLIDDNPIEESEGEDSDASGASKKRKKSDDEDFDDRLEDEDYDLIEENLGVKVERVCINWLKAI